MLLRSSVFAVLVVSFSSIAQADELRQVISREHPAIQGTGSGLTVGPDGSIYVYGGKDGAGYVLRVNADGSKKFGMATTYAITGVAAGVDGVIATSNAHFAKSVSVYDRDGHELGKVGGFTGNDSVGWDGPGTIEAGVSGDFYALDQHAGRIVRVSPAGQIVRSYPLRAEGEKNSARLWSYGFRVSEKNEQFYFIASNEVVCRGFDGTRRWSLKTQVGGDPWGGYTGGFDVDPDGQLYLNDGVDHQIRLYDAKGKPAGDVTLDMGERAATAQRRISHLRVLGKNLIIRQKSDTEIFQVYDRASGALCGAVSIDHEQLAVAYPSAVWTAGGKQPLDIRFNAAGRDVHPQLAAWLRPLGTVKFTRLPVSEGKVEVPAEWSGLFQLRVGSGLEGSNSEYQVQSVIEIRPENARGSISIFTPLNRRVYRRDEPIPYSVVCRSKESPRPAEIEVRLLDDTGREHTRQRITLANDQGMPTTARLDPELISKLKQGEYRLTTTVTGWTIADQSLSLGIGTTQTDGPTFHRVRHGDYSAAYPTTTFYDAPEQIARHLTAARRLDENLYVDRLGHPGSGLLGELPNRLVDSELITRLTNDPLAVAPAKAEFANRVHQTIAAYGTAGIEQQAILLYMDAGLPVGTGFDQRSPEQFARDIESVTKGLADYPAFRGWSWAANWWIAARGAALAQTPEEKSAYEAAYKSAQETGRWDPVLDKVSDRWVNHAVDAERQFRTSMDSAAGAGRRLVSAMTAPYRQPGIIPPLSFAHANEIDLHFQAEQIQWPMISAHNVDFYKRPGRRAWGHPELWNDDGTGGQILSDCLQMVMRGANGIGQSGSTKGFASPDSDPRGMGPGATSVHRRLNGWLAAHGPWLSTLEAEDQVVIPVSTRMLRMELDWKGVGGFYFTRLFEAYNACLRAHRPASFVFAEDCQPDTFTKYKAILLVSQSVELDPQLRAALERASQAGVPIFSDKNCRVELLQNFSPQPLEIEFTRVEHEHHALNDDSAFWRYRENILGHATTLRMAWEKSVPPVAECDHSEVLLSERRLGDVRVLWAVNDAAVPLEPAHLWRVSLAVGSRMPVFTRVRWPGAEGRDVYELFSGQRLEPGADLPVDLRHAPARVFVAVPPGSNSPLPAMKTPVKPEPFAARLRDLVVSRDQKSALITAAGWDHNAFCVDLQTGTVRRQSKVGHHFAYAPASVPNGFAVQGYDLNTAEGYHLYLTDGEGEPSRRFALYGLPKRGTNWAIARQWQEPINSFAVSPDGTWIASAGDLGLVIWSAEGRQLWSHDWWSKDRQRRRLLAVDRETLLEFDGFTATARDARTGKARWSHALGETGMLTSAATNAEGNIVALKSTANGGRVFILRDGKPTVVLATPANEMTLSPDGKYAAVTWQHELRLFDTAGGGLLWSVELDDVLRSPRFSPDGERMVTGSELGTLWVFDVAGQRLLERDLRGLPVADWLEDGGLLVATWLGQLTRLKPNFEPLWSVTLQSDAILNPQDLLALDDTATSRVGGWGNAAPESAPLTPNLLTDTQALIEVRCEPTTHGDPRTLQHKIDLLRDGEPAAPKKPWLEWSDISYLDSGWRSKLVVEVDTFRSQIRLRGVTIAEDAAHPESWTRDMRLQWWDASAEAWRDGPYLLADLSRIPPAGGTVTHTHWFEVPLEAAKFRFVSTGGASWPVGNLRWGELVFHGEVIGPSHPDAVANRPVAVLFDEREEDMKHLLAYGDYPFAFRYDDAASGGKSLALTRAGSTTANWRPPFGHVLPNWDFEIVETPEKPGQYRWLQFAWKAASKETTGMSLRVGPHHGEGVSLVAGTGTPFEGAIESKQTEQPPTEWQSVTVDLWKLNGKPFLVRSLSLGAVGGGALFDHIRLLRTAPDSK